MGGFGSGRHATRATTEDYYALDVRELSRQGVLQPGFIGNWYWKVGGEVRSSLALSCRGGTLELSYQTRAQLSPTFYRYAVFLDWTPCRYGGHRPWLLCPARGCGRRVAVLYGSGLFACRTCLGLVYESQREDRSARLFRKKWRLLSRVGGKPGEDWAPKPRGMHWATFERILREGHEAGDLGFRIGAAKLKLCAEERAGKQT